MKAILICKGLPKISHISLILENGKEYNYSWIKHIKSVGSKIYNIIKDLNLEIISRSYDIDIFQQNTRYYLSYKHIKEYYVEKVKEKNNDVYIYDIEKLDRFTMCKNLNLPIPYHQTRDSRATAMTYWTIIKTLN
jgi:hypothetical protein